MDVPKKAKKFGCHIIFKHSFFFLYLTKLMKLDKELHQGSDESGTEINPLTKERLTPKQAIKANDV